MAKLSDLITFTGSLGPVTAYTMRGVDGIVLRTRGGASREQIRNAPSFEQTRRNNAEFSGRSAASKWIMKALLPLKPLADYNIAGPLNKLLKPVQEMDTVGTWGQRNVRLSACPYALEGFSMNRKTSFDETVKASLSFSLLREERLAGVNLPPLLPGIHLPSRAAYPLYSIVLSLGIVPDLLHTAHGYHPTDPGYSAFAPVVAATDWFPLRKGSPAITLAAHLPIPPPDVAFVLLLAIGLRYGMPSGGEDVQQIAHAGSAKVLAVR